MTSPLERISELAAWLEVAGLDELDLSGPEGRVRLRRGQVVREPANSQESAPGGSAKAGPSVIASPMVGVFLTAHPLRNEPLVRPDDLVRAGHTVGLLRVGPLLAPVAAPQDGVISSIVAADGTLVGYGDPLVEIWPEA